MGGPLDSGDGDIVRPAMSHVMVYLRIGRLERVVGALTSTQKKENVK